MNFLRLFVSGKGLIGMGNSTSPYRMKPGVALPKFVSSKNPFSPPAAIEAAKPELCKPEAAPEEIRVSAPPTTGPVKMETAPLFEASAPEPVKPAVVEAAKPVAPELPPIQPAQPELRPAAMAPAPAPTVATARRLPVGEWVKKLNPLALLPLLPARLPRMRSGRSKAPRAVVQGELSLEKVKVMRNDLSDTDLEIVPARTVKKAGPARSGAAATAALALDEETAWDRLTGRFLNAEETQVR